MSNKIEEQYYKIWLSLIPNLGSIKYLNLINTFKTNKAIFNASKKELMQVSKISDNLAENILKIESRRKAKLHLKHILNNNIKIISITDREYPSNLKDIYSPPLCLYIKGNEELLTKTNISIIGCRDCSNYGKEMAQKFAYELSKNSINIVSGLARGIDSYAHLGAIYGNGKTIAVLGNGLNTIYPKENIQLASKILKTEGAIISEFPLGTEPNKMNFPLRNRIISGLSKGVLVIESKKKSGTLITVDFALEQGRDVFVLPGNINSKCSEGTNELIKQGAKVVTNYMEILEEV